MPNSPAIFLFGSSVWRNAAALCLGSLLGGATFGYGANQTFKPTPTDSNFGTATNWVGGAAPGNVTTTATNADIATFNSTPTNGFGTAASPLTIDTGRTITGITFDTAAAGAFVIGTNAGNQLTLSNTAAGGNSIQLTTTVTTAQIIAAPIKFVAPSATNGAYTFQNNSTTAAATLTLSGAITANTSASRPGGIILAGTNTGANIISGNITSPGQGQIVPLLTKNGAGTWILSGANIFSGTAVTTLTSTAGIQINAGVLSLQNNAALGTNATANANVNNYVNNGGTLELANGITLDNGLTLQLNSGGTIRSNGSATTNASIKLAAGAAVSATLATVNAGDVFTIGNAANDLTGGASDTVIRISGPGTVLLGQASNYAGTFSLNAGTAQLGNATALGSATTASVAFGAGSTGRLQLNGNSPTIIGLSTNATVGTPVVENNAVGAATLTVNVPTAVNNTYAGILQDGAAGGALALTKGGVGTLNLTGASTYSGGTTVGGGTLFVNNASGSGTGTGAVAVNSGGTLAGAGTASGLVTINNGGILAPGNNTVATLTLGSLSLTDGSITNFAFGTGNSQISTGALTLAGTDGINLYQVGGTARFATPGTYTLLGYTSLAGATSSLSVLNQAPGQTYTFNTVGNTIQLTIAGMAAVTSTWTLDANGNYSVAGNWNNGVPNTAGATAIFGSAITAPRTVTVDGTFTVGEIDFNNANAYTLAPGSAGNSFVLDNGGGAAVIKDNGGSHFVSTPISLPLGLNVTVATAGDVLTLSGVISNTGAAGTGTLAKDGAGTLALLGANTFDGGVTITNGTVQINSASSLGAATGTTALNSSTNGVTLEALNSIITTRPFTVNGTSNTIQVDGAATYEIDGVIANGTSPGTLTKTGTGTLALGANNTFMGIVTINAGVLSLGAGGTAGSVTGNIVDNASLVLNRTDSYTLGNVVSGTGTLTQAGTGNVTLSGANTFTGNTVIQAGSLILSNALALQNSTLNYNGQGGALSFGTLTAATLGGLTGAQGLTLTNTAATPAAVALTIGGNNSTTTYSGALSGLGSVVKAGTGTLTLSGASTYTGATTLSAGNLTLIGSIGAAGTPSGAVAINAGVFAVNGGSLNAASLAQNNSASQVTLSGSGTIALTGNLGVGANNGTTNGLVAATSGTLTAASATVGRTGLSYTTLPTTGSTTDGLYVNGATVNIAGALNIGTNTNTNSSANTRIDSGSFTVGGTTFIAVNNGGRYSVLDVNGGTFTSNDTAGGGIVVGGTFASTNAVLLVRAGTLTTNKITLGDATQTSGTDVVTINGGTAYIGGGGIVGAGGGTYAPTVNLTSGTVGATADWSTALPATIGAGGITFQAADISNAAHNITFNGALGGTGALTKTGGGVLLLTANNGFTGATTINAGTLNAGGTGALAGTAAVTVNNGGTLLLGGTAGVTDRINNAAAVTLNGGTMNLGGVSETTGAGTNGVGALTLTATSTLDFGTTGSPNLVQFSGLGTHTAGTVLQVIDWEGNNDTGNGGDRLLFAGASSSFVAQYAQGEVSFNGASGYGTQDFGSYYEVYGITAVPEPTTVLAGCLMVIALGWNQRRRLTLLVQMARR